MPGESERKTKAAAPQASGEGPMALLTPAARSIVEWLADVGRRWGLPADACRVHGLLFLLARPLSAAEIANELALPESSTDVALDWLSAEGLIEGSSAGWTTASDPWTLVMHSLKRRQQQELTAALTVLEPWRRPKLAENPAVAKQARALIDLIDDIAAIDAGTRRLSPHVMRRLIGFGGRAARFAGGAGSKRRGK